MLRKLAPRPTETDNQCYILQFGSASYKWSLASIYKIRFDGLQLAFSYIIQSDVAMRARRQQVLMALKYVGHVSRVMRASCVLDKYVIINNDNISVTCCVACLYCHCHLFGLCTTEPCIPGSVGMYVGCFQLVQNSTLRGRRHSWVLVILHQPPYKFTYLYCKSEDQSCELVDERHLRTGLSVSTT